MIRRAGIVIFSQLVWMLGEPSGLAVLHGGISLHLESGAAADGRMRLRLVAGIHEGL